MKETVIIRNYAPALYVHERTFASGNVVNIFSTGPKGPIITQKFLDFIPVAKRPEYQVSRALIKNLDSGEEFEGTIIEWDLNRKKPINCEPMGE